MGALAREVLRSPRRVRGARVLGVRGWRFLGAWSPFWLARRTTDAHRLTTYVTARCARLGGTGACAREPPTGPGPCRTRALRAAGVYMRKNFDASGKSERGGEEERVVHRIRVVARAAA